MSRFGKTLPVGQAWAGQRSARRLKLALPATPAVNAFTRINENQADRYSLRTVRLPDALASALVKTAEYRYPRPNAVQEALFEMHPSVERRVLAAMQEAAPR